MKALYKYPQSEYPYAKLVTENKERTKEDREFELADTGKERIYLFITYVRKNMVFCKKSGKLCCKKGNCAETRDYSELIRTLRI